MQTRAYLYFFNATNLVAHTYMKDVCLILHTCPHAVTRVNYADIYFHMWKTFACIYFCIAGKPEGRGPEFVKPLCSPQAVENSPVTLECEVIGSPEISIEWHKDDARVRQTTRVRTEFDGRVCRLILLRAELDDEADYMCIAKNDFGMATTECELLIEEDHCAPLFKKKLESQTIKVGQAVTFSVLVTGSPPPEVDWFKNGAGINDNEGYVIKEDVDHGKFSLTVVRATCEDAGTYRCVAFNEVGEASCKAMLDVVPLYREIEPIIEESFKTEIEVPFENQFDGDMAEPVSIPVEPQIKLGKKKLSAARDGPLFEVKDGEPPHFIELPEGCRPFEVSPDSDVKLEVRVSGKPLPEAKWLKDDKPISESTNLLFHSNNDRHTLVIKGPTPREKGTYVCVATNEYGIATRSFDVNIEGYADWVMPSFLEHLESPFQISGDGDVTMEVKVTGNPTPEIEWTQDDQPIEASDRIQVFSKGDNVYSLVIRGAQPADEGKYTCTATNPAGKTMRTYTLNIDGAEAKQVGPVEEAVVPPRVLELPEHGPSCNVSDDRDVKLEVRFSGQPEVEWSKDGKAIQESNHFQIQSRNAVHTMVIKGATPDDKGLYKCTASNKAGMAWKTFTVDFEGKEKGQSTGVPSDLERPLFVEDESVVPFKVTDEGDVKLEARVQGKPQPKVEWDKDEVPLESNEHITINAKNDLHTLVIQSPTMDDKGTYTLTATNKAGVGTRAFNVEIEGSSCILSSLLRFIFFLEFFLRGGWERNRSIWAFNAVCCRFLR